ncbi:MAG: pilus assembly protein N-terminal domain-containing protein [Deltaproteobacteria bacterium]|nr:pilus assembly protein N-terminal domain-containing protein [Deltaproteobacteria bacterium]
MKPLFFTLCATLFVAIFMPAADAAAQRVQRRELEMVVGEQTSISAENVESYSEGREGVVDVRVPSDGERFIIVALNPGATTLLLIYADRQVQYRIRVRSEEEDTQGIQERDNIRLDFYFMQLAETYGHNIGVNWPSSFGGEAFFSSTLDLLAPGFTNATAVVTNQPLPRLDLLQASGWGRIMRQAAVITANGHPASFNSGEEINIAVAGGITGQLHHISVGSNISVTPRYDRETGRVELQVVAEVSNLTEGRGTGVPGRLVSTIDTMVNLEMGQAVILGGLLAESQTMEQSGLPGLSQIPIIGVVFGTKRTQREYGQNVVFIVPTVVDVVSQQARQRITDAFDVYWDYTGGLHDLQLIDMPAGVPSVAHPDGRSQTPTQTSTGDGEE